MILDGRSVAQDLYAGLQKHRMSITETPRLGILVVGVNPVIESFVRIKSREAEKLQIEVMRVDVDAASTTEDVLAAVADLSDRVDSLIVQLPLPPHIDTNTVLAAIQKEKDVDAINPNVAEHLVDAPVALAVIELLERGHVEIAGRRAVVVGAGRLVGAPTAILLRTLGANVSMFTLDEGSIEDLKDADIIVCGAGNPGFIKPVHIKEGVAIIDAGASEQAGVVVGDADPACAEKAAVFTPVPGGVGPVAVAMIFRNLFELLKK